MKVRADLGNCGADQGNWSEVLEIGMARGTKKPPTAPEPTGTVEWLLGTCSVHVQHLMDKGGKRGYRSLFTSDESRKEFKKELKHLL